jgi:hypothetical protein
MRTAPFAGSDDGGRDGGVSVPSVGVEDLVRDPSFDEQAETVLAATQKPRRTTAARINLMIADSPLLRRRGIPTGIGTCRAPPGHTDGMARGPSSTGGDIVAEAILVAVGAILLALHRRMRALNESVSRRRPIIILSTYVIPTCVLVIGVVLLVSHAL